MIMMIFDPYLEGLILQVCIELVIIIDLAGMHILMIKDVERNSIVSVVRTYVLRSIDRLIMYVRVVPCMPFGD